MGEEETEVHFLLPAQILLWNVVEVILTIFVLLKQLDTHQNIEEFFWFSYGMHFASVSQLLAVQFPSLKSAEDIEINGSFDDLTSPDSEHDVL